MLVLIFMCFGIAAISAGPATEASYKGQYCTDPRTMRKHAAYTEWADAYSCTRHRCQPGGRNLAIYTVGCKRVEAPESAIECEEVVEDTNMQFPYCCTRLRCLVVVRGEVWTRVLGQPWETLPAAPWSHMYKMKKPPPGAEGTFLPKMGEGPVYELQTESDNQNAPDPSKVLRTRKKTTDSPDCDNPVASRSAPAPVPDIVIALSTNSDKDPLPKKDEGTRHKRGKSSVPTAVNLANYFDEENAEPRAADDLEEQPVTEKEKEKISSYGAIEPNASEEKFYQNAYGVTEKPARSQHQQVTWTEIPQNQWNEHEPGMEADMPVARKAPVSQENKSYQQPEFSPLPEEKKEEKVEKKSGNLQALVDAIGTRMRDIESVVQRMSEKVQRAKPGTEIDPASAEKNSRFRANDIEPDHQVHDNKEVKPKKPNLDNEHYRRFANERAGTKYLHTNDEVTTEPPLFVEDSSLNGYFSDASNTLVRRAMPKEPAATYMAPVDSGASRRKMPHEEVSEENDKKRKKRVHKKKRKGSHHKKHHGKDEKRRKFRLNSVELDRNAVSLEDSSIPAANA